MEGKATCPVCGGLDYFKAEGFYYCSECQVQSQEIREEVHEYSNLNAGQVKEKIIIKKKKKIEDEEWTSWELHNFVLKGFVDELIALGATDKLKIVVLQLWATYLKKIKAAFLPKLKSSQLPKLGIGFHARDARLLYNVDPKKRRRKIRKEMKTHEGDVSVNSIPDINEYGHLKKTDYHRSKRALFKVEYDKSCDQMELDAYNLLNDSMKTYNSSDTVNKSQNKKIKRSYLSNAAASFIQSESGKKSYASQIYKCPETLTRSTLIAMVYIALMICQDKIQLSDILRWSEEGDLSYYEVSHFLPVAQKLKGMDVLIFGPSTRRLSYSGISESVKDLAVFLQVTHIPSPDIKLLLKRYIEELQLPVEMVTLVERLMCFSGQLEEFGPSSKKEIIQNYEGRIMGFIIVTLKLLLGLDGETEYKVSEVAEKLNKLRNSTSESAKLFVWTDWVKYIECRKSLLAQFHFPTQDALFQDTVLDPSAYIDFWTKAKSKDVNRKDRIIITEYKKKHDPQVIDEMSSILQKLQNMKESNSKMPEFVPTFMPQKTNLETLFTTKPEDFESAIAAGSILKQDFTGTSMKYLIEPESYLDLAEKNDVEITVERNSAQVKIQIVEKVTENSFHDKRTLYQIESNSEAIFCSPDSSAKVEHSLSKHIKRVNIKSELCSQNKRFKSDFSESSQGNSSFKDVKVISENNDSSNKKAIYDSSKNSDTIDHFKSLHHLTKNILLRQLKQKNIEVEHLFLNKKTESNSPVPLKCTESSDPSARTRKAHSQKKIAQPSSLRSLGSADSFCSSSGLLEKKESCYRSPKSSKFADFLKNVTLARDEYLKKNNIEHEHILEKNLSGSKSQKPLKNNEINMPIVQGNCTSGSANFTVDSDKNCEMNNKTNRRKQGTETESNSTLYISNSVYWIYDAFIKKLSSEIFEFKVMTKFPFSFQWLLKECARILHMNCQELYAEVLNIELMLSNIEDDLNEKRRN